MPKTTKATQLSDLRIFNCKSVCIWTINYIWPSTHYYIPPMEETFGAVEFCSALRPILALDFDRGPFHLKTVPQRS